MSGIFGIFNRNGRPVDQDSLNAMQNSISYWQPDDCGTWSDGPVALGHSMLWNSPESKLESLPQKRDHLVITMDARLDNREELASQLDIGIFPLYQLTDSNLIIEAYRKWGEDCPKHLLGDFCFVIWDKKKQLLFCARDHVGIKQIFYCLEGERLLLSNDINALSYFPGVPQKTNDYAVAIYLTVGQLWHPSITFFESIKKIPPATTVIFTSNNTTKRTYWKAEDSPEVHYKSTEEYSERLRELLEDSIHKRIRSEWPIASHLSGGLDSSTIAVIASRNLQTRGKSLRAYNWLPEPTEKDDRNHYEWSNSRRISQLEKIDHHYVELSAQVVCEILENHDIRMNDTVDFWYEFIVRKEAQNDSVRTILSGWGGDELVSHGAREYYTDLLWQGKIITALVQIAKMSKSKEMFLKTVVAIFYRNLIAPIFPNWIRYNLPYIKDDREEYLQFAKPDFLQFARKHYEYPSHDVKTIHEDQLYYFNLGYIVCRIESWASSAIKHRTEYCYPLLDRRVVEYALGIPKCMYFREGKRRYIFRTAVQDLLPDEWQHNHFKIEHNRVTKLLEINNSAVRLWLNNFEKNLTGKFSSKYIDFYKLQKDIKFKREMTEVTFDEEFDRIISIIKSIFTFKLQ